MYFSMPFLSEYLQSSFRFKAATAGSRSTGGSHTRVRIGLRGGRDSGRAH